MSNIEPQKIFVKFIPTDTTIDEIKTFFNICGKVLYVNLVSPKIDQATYMLAFINYETQTGADRAVSELNNKQMKNSQGHSQRLSVVHSLLPDARKEPSVYSVASSKEYQNLWQTCRENAEKINQIYNKPKEQREIEELRTKKYELEAKQIELKKTQNTIKEEIKLLRLQLKIKTLEMENTKLKEAQ